MPEIRKSFAKYLKIKATNWTLLKEMNNSALHYDHRRLNPREDSIGLARGRAVHTVVLEPEKFASEYVVYTGERRQGNAWKEFQDAYEGFTILKQDEYDKVMHAGQAVRRHPEAFSIIKDCSYEKTFTWTDKATKIKCKCRVDGIGAALFDLKTTGNVDARIFGNLAARMLYYGQIAMYADGAKHNTGDVFLIAVESEPPHDVAVFRVGEDDLIAGRELYQSFLTRVRECTDSGVWPGRYPEVQALSLPKYVWGNEEDGGGGSYEVVSE
jgi:hypothetical protein